MADFTGTSGDDIITGTEDSDFIDVSQGGNDTVNAEGGDDVVYIGAALNKGDHIDGGDGFDTLQLDGNYSRLTLNANLVANIESVTLAAGHDYHIKIANTVVAANGSLTIDASALGAGDGATLDATGVKRGTLTLTGGAGDDTLIGGQKGHALDILNGGAGNDTIYSDGTNFNNFHTIGGPHTIDGGDGNDTIYAANGDTVTGGDGNDTINFANYFLGHSGSIASVDAGAGDDNVIFFIAEIGPGQLQGGAGTDTLEVDSTLNLNMQSFSAASSGFEIIAMQGLYIGDQEDNTFDFSGFTPASTSGELTVSGGIGDDTLTGTSGSDWFHGGDDNDVLSTGSGNDFLFGENGNDTLIGGSGQDVLTGGAGSDTFVFASLDDSPTGPHHRDEITDFTHSDGDLIDLSAIDADTTQDGNQAFHLGGNTFTDTPGELIQFIDRQGLTIVQGDVNGDGIADFAIRIDGGITLTADDFVL